MSDYINFWSNGTVISDTPINSDTFIQKYRDWRIHDRGPYLKAGQRHSVFAYVPGTDPLQWTTGHGDSLHSAVQDCCRTIDKDLSKDTAKDSI